MPDRRPVTEVPIHQFRPAIADHINNAQNHGACVILTSRGRPAAALVPIALLEQVLEQERAEQAVTRTG